MRFNLVKASTWVANVSRLSYDFAKGFVMLLKEQGVPVLDDEMNFMSLSSIALTRNIAATVTGDGSPDTGFKAVGAGASNDFTIKAGNFLLEGWLLTLGADVQYSAQPVAQSALTTPGGSRTDEVYLDIWLDEIDGTEDSSIIDPTLNLRTSTRLKLFWAIKVAEGGTTPANGLDGNSLYHWRYKVATLARTATAAINSGMVTDNRRVIGNATIDATDILTKLKTVDGSGSGLDADLLDGVHMSNGSMGIPQNNGTVNTNLNADMLDGWHAGNGAGQIPFNNGNLNNTLNADMVDGCHVGNASGNVAYNNGALNSNLNSEMLAGNRLHDIHYASHTLAGLNNTINLLAGGSHAKYLISVVPLNAGVLAYQHISGPPGISEIFWYVSQSAAGSYDQLHISVPNGYTYDMSVLVQALY